MNLHVSVQSSISHASQKLEATQLSFTWWVAKHSTSVWSITQP